MTIKSEDLTTIASRLIIIIIIKIREKLSQYFKFLIQMSTISLHINKLLGRKLYFIIRK